VSPRGRLARDIGAGAVAGSIATLAMSVPMLLGQRAGLLGRQPPRVISDALVARFLGNDADEATRRLGTTIVHLGIGAGAGAVQQVARRTTRQPQPAAAWGAAAGGAFWTLNYFVLAPAAGLLPPANRDRPGRPPVMLASNMLWGAVGAALGDRLAGRERALVEG
jgi:hypothetical protein